MEDRQALAATSAPPWAWLEAERARFWREPSQAAALIPAAQARFEPLRDQPPTEFGVALAAHLIALFDEDARWAPLEAALALGLGWVEQGLGRAYRVTLLARQCRQHAFMGRVEAASELLERLNEPAAQPMGELDRARRLWALSSCLRMKQDYRRALECLQEATRIFEAEAFEQDFTGGIYLSLIWLLHRMDEHERGLALSRHALAQCLRRRSWHWACNAHAGLAQEWLRRDEPGRAAEALAEARALLPRLSPACRARYEPELMAAEAMSCAAQQDHAGAVGWMRQFLAMQAEQQVLGAETVRRLKQLAPWLVKVGEQEEALSTLERAHELELQAERQAQQEALARVPDRAELKHARDEQQRAIEHGRALELQNLALAESLQLQRELQEALSASSRLAALGSLWAGVSHELNTPLGVSLTVLSTLVERGRALGQRVQAGGLSRSGLRSDVAMLSEGAALSQGNLQRALTLIASYREGLPEAAVALPSPPDLALQDLVQRAWRHALGETSPLSLLLEPAEPLRVAGDTLGEVLVQLFQNVERHAYGAGQAGVVRVSLGRRGHQCWLHVQDQGQGIAPELLPHVFDPYVSTQFGQGRSGLGLFRAQALVSKGLQGRMQVKSEPGRGACFEIEWLQIDTSPTDAAQAAPLPPAPADVELPLEPLPAAAPDAGPCERARGYAPDATVMTERWAWLRAAEQRYEAEPAQAEHEIAATLALFDEVQNESPSDFGVALAAHLADLLAEDYRYAELERVQDIGLLWAGLGLGAAHHVALLARQCRRHAFAGRAEQAGAMLDQLAELSAGPATEVDRAHYLQAMAACLHLKQDYRAEVECLQKAAHIYEACDYRKGGWAMMHVAIAIEYRALGESEPSLDASRNAVRLSLLQRRWHLACNALTGMVGVHAARGEQDLAAQACAEARAYLPRLSAAARQRYEPEVLAAEAMCCAARQDFAAAVTRMQQCLDVQQASQIIGTDRERRLRTLLPWLLKIGQGEQALLVLAQAHGLAAERMRTANQQELARMLERAVLQQARAEIGLAQAQARELALRNQALAESLRLQHELQEELVASSRLASLGGVLAGVSQALQTPLEQALGGLGAMAERAQAVAQRVESGELSRSGLLADVAAMVELAASCQGQVEQALALIAGHKNLLRAEVA